LFHTSSNAFGAAGRGELFAIPDGKEAVIISVVPDAEKILWEYADPDYFGSSLTWSNLSEGTEYASLPGSNSASYVPGCSPTALGSMMLYYMKYHPIFKEYKDEIVSINTDKVFSFEVDYVDPIQKTSSKKTIKKKRVKDKYDWDNMPDRRLNYGEEGYYPAIMQDIQNNISPLLMDLGIRIGVHYRFDGDGLQYSG
jgi:hypothetical protein